MRRTSKRKPAESVTPRKLAKQYEKLATLVDFANLAREFGLKAEMVTDPWNDELIFAPITDEVSERVGKQMWQAAAKQFGWPTHGRICLPGFPDTSFRWPAGFFASDREALVYTVAMVDATLRYLVHRTAIAGSFGIFRMPGLPSYREPLCEISKDHRLSYTRFSIFEDMLAPALISPPDERRHYVDLSLLRICPRLRLPFRRRTPRYPCVSAAREH